MIGDDIELRTVIAEERVHAQVAREIHALRTGRGLTPERGIEGPPDLRQAPSSRSTGAKVERRDLGGEILHGLREIKRGARLQVPHARCS